MKINKMQNGEPCLNFGRFFLGFFIVLVGIIFLLNSLNIFLLNINFWNIWPVLIIFIGLSFFNSKNLLSMLLGVIVTMLSMIMLFLSFFNPYVAVDKSQMLYFPLAIAKDSNANTASVTINTGGANVIVGSSDSENLVSGGLRSNMTELKTDSEVLGGSQKVEVGLEGGNRWINGNVKNNLSVDLDKTVPLEFYLKSGASTDYVDLSDVTAKIINITSGASQINLKLGDKVDSSNVKIDAGASSINLVLPKDAGVQIITDSSSISKELTGLELVNKNTYQSSNYGSSQKKINININLSISSLNIDWYGTSNGDVSDATITNLETTCINLFYYRKSADSNNACTSEFVLPVARQVPVSDNQIKDSINLLLQGSLTSQEMDEGFYPYFPNNNFKLIDSNLDANGTLTLTFNEVAGFTNGNFCRDNVLALEIAKTARQFPEVKKVIFKPDSLFEE